MPENWSIKNKKTRKQLLHEIKLKTSWGPEFSRKVDEIIDRLIRENPQNKAHIIKQAQEKREIGVQAYQIIQHLENLLSKQHSGQLKHNKLLKTLEQEFPQQMQHGEIRDLVTHSLEKAIQYKNMRTKQVRKGPPKTSVTCPITKNGVHPNSLRHMKPSQQWQVIIDETGNVFDNTAETLAYNSVSLGRVVALVIPQHLWGRLPDKSSHHATDAADKTNDKIINTLLNSKVGIFGFTFKDDGLLYKYSWFSSIHLLMRWVMYLLPVDQENTTHVTFKIERRTYGPEESLSLWAEQLEGELKTLHPKRYKNCHLKMEFIEKSGSPYNGYVDTIAHMWGSPSPAAKKRLQASQLVGHCLLRPDNTAIERLYLAMNSSYKLEASQWYTLCVHLPNEPKNTLLSDFMQNLGKAVTTDTRQWQQYMSYVNNLLKQKNFRLKELYAVLDWLETFKPVESQLPPIAQLYLYSTKIVLANHQGKVEPYLLETALTLSEKLKEEIAVDVFQLLLRIAVAYSNNFEFSRAQQLLEPWLQQPVATIGRLNYAKLQSSIGQFMAFQHHHVDAQKYFQQAEATFNQMSDVSSVVADIQQTRIYHIINSMNNHCDATDIETMLWDVLSLTGKQKKKKKWIRSISLADPQQKQVDHYQHHLLLRCFVYYPQYFAQDIDTYIQYKKEWLYEQYHPWQWIALYRGWLLWQKKDEEKAIHWFKYALEICFANNSHITMLWIGKIISVLIQKITNHNECLQNYVKHYHHMTLELEQHLPHAPHNILQRWIADDDNSDAKQIFYLQQCVPFNFH